MSNPKLGSKARRAKRAAIEASKARHYARQSGLRLESECDLGMATALDHNGGMKEVPARLLLDGRSTSQNFDGKTLQGRIHTNTINLGSNFQRRDIDKGIGSSIKGTSKSRLYRDGHGSLIRGTKVRFTNFNSNGNPVRGGGTDLTIVSNNNREAKAASLKNRKFAEKQAMNNELSGVQKKLRKQAIKDGWFPDK